MGTFDEITCLKDGNWSDISFNCKILDCGYPATIINGGVDFNETTFGSHARFFCNIGMIY